MELTPDPKLAREITQLRNEIRDLGKRVRKLAEPTSLLQTIPSEGGLRSEAYANAMLAFRHVEDGRMRLGKIMQQAQGGESIYDKQEQESVSEPAAQ